MENNLSISQLTKQEDILSVLKEIHYSYSPPLDMGIENFNDYAKKIEKQGSVYVIKNNTILGSIVLYVNDLDSPTAFITQLDVKEKFQSQGLGKKLMQHAYKVALDKGKKRMRLEVEKINKRAIHFYKKEGFSLAEENKDSYYFEKVLNEKKNENRS